MPKLRDRLDELLDRVEAGETIRITRDDRAIAEMRPVKRERTRDEIVAAFQELPPMDPEAFRRDVHGLFSE